MRTTLVLLLALAPLFVVIVQQRALRRQANTLDDLPAALQATAMWRIAASYLDRRSFVTKASARAARIGTARSNFAFWFSLGLVCVIMLLSWNFALDAPIGSAAFVNEYNPFLLGPKPRDAAAIAVFQRETLGVSVIGFAVAYTSIVFSMAVRLNTNDLSATRNIFDAVHLCSSILVATLGRVVLDEMDAPLPLAVMFAVVAGMRPDFWLDGLGRAASSILTQSGSPLAVLRRQERAGLSGDNLAVDVQLEAVDGISDGVADRLRQIDVGTCHRLGFNNIFVIWVRTTFTLPEVLDWCGQALLLLYFSHCSVALRQLGVRTIMDLLNRIDAGSPQVQAALGIAADEAAHLAAALRRVPQIIDATEVADALLAVRQKG